MDTDTPSDGPLQLTDKMTKRQKVIKTIWIFWAIMLVGFTNAILGPSLISLLSISGAGVSSFSIVFFIQGLGFVTGIIGGALVSKILPTSFFLCIAIFLACFANGALPWMYTFPGLICFLFLQFLLKGVVDYGAMSACGQLWPVDNHVPFQFVSIGVGLGAFLSPFFVYPVLKFPSDTSHMHCVIPHLAEYNSTVCNAPIAAGNSIYIPFLIIALIMLPPGVAFAHYSIRERGEPNEKWIPANYESLSDDGLEIETESSGISVGLYWLILSLLLLFYVPFGGLFVTYSHLLTAFGVESDLKMAPSSLALMTSMYWGCFLAGRLMNTLFSAYMNQFVLIICNFIGLLVSLIILLSFASRSEVALWIGTALLSLFNSVFLPGVMTWVGSYISLERKAISLSLTGLGIGELTIPYIAASAFNYFGPMSLMWVVLGLCCFELLLFIILSIILSTKLKRVCSLSY